MFCLTCSVAFAKTSICDQFSNCGFTTLSRKALYYSNILFLLHLSFSGNQKGKRRGAQQAGGAGAKKGHDGKEKKPEKSSDKLTPNRSTGLSTQAQPFDTRTGAPSVISERSDSSDVTDDKKRLSIAKVQKHRQSSAIMNPPLIPQAEESKPPTEEEEREKELTKK